LSKNYIAYIQMSIAMIIIGSFVVIGKFILEEVPVFLASELRLLIANFILIPLFYFKEKKLPKVNKKDARIFIIQAFVGVFLFSVCTLYGLKYTTALESGLILSCTPAVMALIAYFFLKEKLGATKLIGILFTVLGTMSINIIGTVATGNVNAISIFGNFLIFLAVIGDAVFFSFGKLLSDRWSPLAISMILSILGSIFFLPLAVYEALHIDFSSISLSVWGWIIYTGTIVTVVAVILMNQGLKKVPASVASVFTALTPVSTVLLSSIFLKESIYWYHLLGMVFILLGILMLTNTNKEPKMGKIPKNNIF